MQAKEDREGPLRDRFEWWMWSRLCGSKLWTIGLVPSMSAVDPWRCRSAANGRESIPIPPLFGDEHPAILAIFGFTRVPGL